MIIIKLTSLQDGVIIRINPDHIVCYWDSDKFKGSEIKVSIGAIDQGIVVKETADEIDKLLGVVV